MTHPTLKDVHRFMVDAPLRPGKQRFALDPAETRHAMRVLRLREGDEVGLCDGEGRSVRGTVDMVNGHERTIHVTHPSNGSLPCAHCSSRS